MASIIQTYTFAASYSGTGDVNFILAPGGLTTGDIVVPFDSSSGTLTSFTLAWDIQFDTKGIAGASGGGTSAGAGGPYLIGGLGFTAPGGGGAGGGQSAGAGPFLPFDAPDEVAKTIDFEVPPVSYDPAVAAAVEGTSDYSLSWDAPYTGFVTGASSWTVSVIGTASITYNCGSCSGSTVVDVAGIPFVETPEPSSVAPMLLAIAFMARLHRRRLKPALVAIMKRRTSL